MKKKILLDVDDVVCDSGFLYLMNRFLNTNYILDEFDEYYIDDIIGSDEKKQEFYQYLLDNNSYQYATLLPDAYDVIKKLNDKYDIYICSACVMRFFKEKSGKLFAQKYEYLVNALPFLEPNKFIFTNTKSIIKADIQIDDRLSNLDGDIELKLLFHSYHNKNITDEELKEKNVVRVSGWKDIERVLL